MRFDKLTLKAQDALQEAQALATRYQHSSVDVEHLLAALLFQDEGVTRPILEKLSVDPGTVRAAIEKEMESAPKVQGAASYGANLTGRLQQTFNTAFAHADSMQDEFVSTEHLLLA